MSNTLTDSILIHWRRCQKGLRLIMDWSILDSLVMLSIKNLYKTNYTMKNHSSPKYTTQHKAPNNLNRKKEEPSPTHVYISRERMQREDTGRRPIRDLKKALQLSPPSSLGFGFFWPFTIWGLSGHDREREMVVARWFATTIWVLFCRRERNGVGEELKTMT